MDNGTAITEQLFGEPIADIRRWSRNDRWLEGIIDTGRYPAMGIAQTDSELEEIGRLRYDLFIDRDGKRYAHADHETKTFLEPIEKISLNFVARAQNRCAVAVRATWANDTIVDPHLEQVVAYADLDPETLHQTIVNSRLAARPSTIARSLITPLFQCMFTVALQANARFCMAATRSGLIPLFERFGFYQLNHRRPYFDEVAGWMSVLVLDLHDRERLLRTDSPYLLVYDEFYSQCQDRKHL